MAIPSTAKRVPRSTESDVNRRISAETEERVEWYAGNALLIASRLKELDREWDIERALEANAALAGFAGIALGATVDRRFYILPALVTAFLFQHAIQGWCPPLPVLRRMGFRTAREIDVERTALKALRGDFRGGKGGNRSARQALAAARS